MAEDLIEMKGGTVAAVYDVASSLYAHASDSFDRIATGQASAPPVPAQSSTKTAADQLFPDPQYPGPPNVQEEIGQSLGISPKGARDPRFTYGLLPQQNQKEGLYGAVAADVKGNVHALVDVKQIELQGTISGLDQNGTKELFAAIVKQEVAGKILTTEPKFKNMTFPDQEIVAEQIALKTSAYLSTHLGVMRSDQLNYSGIKSLSNKVLSDTLKNSGANENDAQKFAQNFLNFRQRRYDAAALTGLAPRTDIVEDYAGSIGIKDPVAFRENLQKGLQAAYDQKSKDILKNF
jgi:hypothetical protein